MKPPFTYLGGKQKIASSIIKLIPRHTVYVEPFVGAATVMFAKPWPDETNSHYYREVINDLNSDVVNLFKQLRDNGEELCRQLHLTLYSEEDHRIAKDRNIENDLERARRFFIQTQQSFASSIGKGWGRAKSNLNHPVSSMLNKVDSLPEYIERMRGVYVCNNDALKVIEQFDSPQTFFYCDPPYVGTEKGVYQKQNHGGDYNKGDYQKLIEKLDSIQGSFLLSGYKTNLELDHWEEFRIRTYCATSTINRSKDVFEHVWRKLRSCDPKPNIAKRMLGPKFKCFTGDKYKAGPDGEIVKRSNRAISGNLFELTVCDLRCKSSARLIAFAKKHILRILFEDSTLKRSDVLAKVSCNFFAVCFDSEVLQTVRDDLSAFFGVSMDDQVCLESNRSLLPESFGIEFN